MKQGHRFIFLLLCMIAFTARAMPNSDTTQTIQIYTMLHSYVGKPSWLLLIRDLDSQNIYPYLYDIKKSDQFYLALTFTHHYQIVSSQMSFNPYGEVINNFCQLENRMYQDQSIYITLKGDLSEDKNAFECHAMVFPETEFTIAN